MIRRGGRRRRKLLDDLKGRRAYSHLMKKALDRTTRRNSFRGDFGPVVKQNTEWMNPTQIEVFRVFSSLQVSLPNFCRHFTSAAPYMPHLPSFSFHLIWTLCLPTCKDHEAPQCAFFSSFFRLRFNILQSIPLLTIISLDVTDQVSYAWMNSTTDN